MKIESKWFKENITGTKCLCYSYLSVIGAIADENRLKAEIIEKFSAYTG